MTLNADSSALYGRHAGRTFVAGFRFDDTHKCRQRGRRGSGLEDLAPAPCGQLTRCFSAVAELLVLLLLLFLLGRPLQKSPQLRRLKSDRDEIW